MGPTDFPPTEAVTGDQSKARKPRMKRISKRDWKESEDIACGCEPHQRDEPEVVKWVRPVNKDNERGRQMSLNFQVADVKNPLLAVKRITEQGNHVSFGPGAEDNFILNKRTRDKTPMVDKQGNYIMEVEFVGGWKTEIVVDSGCPNGVRPYSGRTLVQRRLSSEELEGT